MGFAKWILIVLFGLLLSLCLMASLRNKEPLFSYSHCAIFCGKCGAVEHHRRFQAFGRTFEKTWIEETLLKREVFDSIHHSKAHGAFASLQKFDSSFDLAKGLHSTELGNYWSTDKSHTWIDGPPTASSQNWTNHIPTGFCLHNDPAFVHAFKRLNEMDPAWAAYQLDYLAYKLGAKVFPGSLIQFISNRNEQAIFLHLQQSDLGAELSRSVWQRDYQKFPLGAAEPGFRSNNSSKSLH